MAVCVMVLFIFASGACIKYDKTKLKTEEIIYNKYGSSNHRTGVDPEVRHDNPKHYIEVFTDERQESSMKVVQNIANGKQSIIRQFLGEMVYGSYDTSEKCSKENNDVKHDNTKLIIEETTYVKHNKNSQNLGRVADESDANITQYVKEGNERLSKLLSANTKQTDNEEDGSHANIEQSAKDNDMKQSTKDNDEKHTKTYQPDKEKDGKQFRDEMTSEDGRYSKFCPEELTYNKCDNRSRFVKETAGKSHDNANQFLERTTRERQASRKHLVADISRESHGNTNEIVGKNAYEKQADGKQVAEGIAHKTFGITKRIVDEIADEKRKQFFVEIANKKDEKLKQIAEEIADERQASHKHYVPEISDQGHENTKQVLEKFVIKRQTNPKQFIAGITHERLDNTKQIVDEDADGRQGNSRKIDIAAGKENSSHNAIQCFIEKLPPRGLIKNMLDHVNLNSSNNVTVCSDNHNLTSVYPQVKTDIVKIITKQIFNRSELINNKNSFGETALLSSASMNDTELFEVILKERADPYLSTQQKMTSLHYAAKNVNARIIFLILEKTKTGIDFQNSLGETALLIAAKKNDSNICMLLLEYCANPYVADIFGNNTLHVSSKTGNLDIVRIILSNDKSGINLKNDVGMTAIHLAAEMKHGEVVEILLEHGADPFETNLFHRTALHTAVKVNCSGIVDAILNKTNSGIDVRDKEGNTALHMAAMLEEPWAAGTLLDHGANPNLPNNRRQTPLHAAAWNISYQPLFEIIYKTRIDGKEAEQNLFFPRYATGIRQSVQVSPPNVLQMLLGNKKTELNPQDNNGDTAVQYAVISGRQDAVNDLLQHGADPYLQNEQGNTPLHVAILSGSDSIAETILKRNRTGIDIRNKHNYTALFYALYYTKIRLYSNMHSIDNVDEKAFLMILRIDNEYFYNIPHLDDVPYSLIPSQLFEKQFHVAEEADPHGLYLNPPKNADLFFFSFHFPQVIGDGRSVGLFRPKLELNENEMTHAQSAQIRLLGTLLKHGADTKLTDRFGRTILHAAAEFLHNRCIERMSLESAINAQDNKGSTPILNAAKKSNYFAVEWFLKNSADPYIKDKDGETCLHAAARAGNMTIIRLILIYNDTGINEQNSKGKTALIIASENYDIYMVILLLNSGADPYLTDISGRTALHKVVVEWIKTVFLDVTRQNFVQDYVQDNPRICLKVKLNSNKCLLDAGIIGGKGEKKEVYEIPGVLVKDAVVNTVRTLLYKNSSGINKRDVNGYSALFLAAMYCGDDVIELLLNKGADPYLQDKAGHTSLHAFISRKDLGRGSSILRMLIKGGEGINLADNDGFTALHFAVLRKEHNLVTLLSESGADPNIQDKYHGLSPFYFALRFNCRLICNYLLSNNFTNLNIMSKTGKSSLHYATDENIFHSLLQNGAELNYDYLGWTPLHYSGYHGSINKIKVILARFPRSIDARTYLGETTLSIAVEKGNLEITEYLLKLGADPRIPNDLLQTSLEKAAMTNNSAVFKTLFEKGVDPFVINSLGYSCLHVVSQLGNIGNAELIFHKYNGKIDHRDRVGHTPLHYAISRKQYGFVEFLLNRSASPFAFDNYGQNALHYASEGSSREIVAAIYDNAEHNGNAVDLNKFINKRNFLEISPVEIAAASGNKEAFLYLLEKGADLHVPESSILITAAIGGEVGIIQHILDKTDTAVDSMTITGFPALMAAAYNGRMDAFYYLLGKGADPQMITAYGQTLLHHAAIGGDIFILNTSLSFCKAYINSIDVEGYTPLMYAVQNDNVLAVELLLSNNADPNVKNINGEDSFTLAARKGNKVLKSSFLKVNQNSDVLLGTLLVRKDITLTEDILLELAAKSSLSKDPVFLAAAKGDIHQLHELFAAGVRVRNRSFPGIMKEFMRDLDDVMASLVSNDEFIQSYERRLSPLDIAVLFRNNLSVVKFLAQKLNVDLEALNYGKALWTPLDFAIFAHDRKPSLKTQQVLFYFLNAYKDKVNHKSNIYKWTLVHKTAWIGNLLVFRFLRSFGADLDKADVFGRTPLHIAALNGHSEIVKSILRTTKNSINSKDVHGFTPLLLCHVYKHRKLFQRLSTAKADMDPKERFKFVELSSLFVNTFEGKHDLFLETAAFLIDEEADMNVQDRAFGWTALHWAVAWADYLGVVQLVSRGATVNIPSWTGETPMALARKWVRKATYNYLKKHNGVW